MQQSSSMSVSVCVSVYNLFLETPSISICEQNLCNVHILQFRRQQLMHYVNFILNILIFVQLNRTFNCFTNILENKRSQHGCSYLYLVSVHSQDTFCISNSLVQRLYVKKNSCSLKQKIYLLVICTITHSRALSPLTANKH